MSISCLRANQICKLMYYLLWHVSGQTDFQKTWPGSANPNCCLYYFLLLSTMGIFWYDGCTEEGPMVTPLRHFKKQPRWLPLMCPPCAHLIIGPGKRPVVLNRMWPRDDLVFLSGCLLTTSHIHREQWLAAAPCLPLTSDAWTRRVTGCTGAPRRSAASHQILTATHLSSYLTISNLIPKNNRILDIEWCLKNWFVFVLERHVNHKYNTIWYYLTNHNYNFAHR